MEQFDYQAGKQVIYNVSEPLKPESEASTLLYLQSSLEAKLDALEVIIHSAEHGAMGLTLESAKTPEWREAKSKHAKYFAQLRIVNGQLNKIRKHVGYENVNGKRVSIYKYK